MIAHDGKHHQRHHLAWFPDRQATDRVGEVEHSEQCAQTGGEDATAAIEHQGVEHDRQHERKERLVSRQVGHPVTNAEDRQHDRASCAVAHDY